MIIKCKTLSLHCGEINRNCNCHDYYYRNKVNQQSEDLFTESLSQLHWHNQHFLVYLGYIISHFTHILIYRLKLESGCQIHKGAVHVVPTKN